MKKSEISQHFMKYLPVEDGEIVIGDHFMVTQPFRKDYEVIYRCTGYDCENRICKNDEHTGLSHQLIAKVDLFKCTKLVGIDDQVIVNYNIYLHGLVVRVYEHGFITADADRKYWLIVNNNGQKCMAPKQHTFKISEITIQNNGNRRAFSGGVRTPAPS